MEKEKIIFRPKDFRRNASQGIKDAVIDIFCFIKNLKYTALIGVHFPMLQQG